MSHRISPRALTHTQLLIHASRPLLGLELKARPLRRVPLVLHGRRLKPTVHLNTPTTIQLIRALAARCRLLSLNTNQYGLIVDDLVAINVALPNGTPVAVTETTVGIFSRP